MTEVALQTADDSVMLVAESDAVAIVFVEQETILLTVGEQGLPGVDGEDAVGLPDPSAAPDGQLVAVLDGAYVLTDPPTSGVWGQITGDIADQADLQAALTNTLAFAASYG